jgi:hypothetical protein
VFVCDVSPSERVDVIICDVSPSERVDVIICERGVRVRAAPTNFKLKFWF